MKEKPIFTPDMLEFMMELRFNNNKAFMSDNRQEYLRRMHAPYYRLIQNLAPGMVAIDPKMEVRPNKVLSRIFRDTRFSKNKEPYRDHHWIAFRRQGEPRDKAVMFWFEIRLENVSWGLGFWGENRKAMEILRRRMISNPAELVSLQRILSEYQFRLEGDKYKRISIPEGLHPELVDWYVRKDIYLVKNQVDASQVFKTGFAKQLIEDFQALAPFYHLLRGSYELSMTE